jgi:hypothetical protein
MNRKYTSLKIKTQRNNKNVSTLLYFIWNIKSWIINIFFILYFVEDIPLGKRN